MWEEKANPMAATNSMQQKQRPSFTSIGAVPELHNQYCNDMKFHVIVLPECSMVCISWTTPKVGTCAKGHCHHFHRIFLMYGTTPMKYWLHALSTNPYVHHTRPSTSVLSCKHLHIKFHQWIRRHSIRCTDLIRLLQLVVHPYFSGMWLGVHLRTETK